MSWSNLLWNLAHIAPALIVYLLAAILGLANLKKHKPAAVYAMLGGIIALLVSVSAMFARELIWANKNNNGGDIETTLMLSRVVSIGANIVEAVGMAMIVFAVYVGRKPLRDDDDERPRRRLRVDDEDDRPRRSRPDDDPPTARASRPRS